VATAGASSIEVSPQRAAELLAAGSVQLVDVGTSEEFAARHIAGARHIVLDDLGAEALTFDRQRPVFFCSGRGEAAAEAARAFREAGFNAAALRGGIEEWASEGFELEGIS
jgi:rhodanese-related sulfurtransferase